MSIDRTTYELYIMDYLDGRLDAVVVSELLLFLEQNPDLKEEFEGMRSITLDKNTDAFSIDKNALKKPAYDEVKHLYEPMLIARMEGDETLQQVSLLNKAEQLYPELKKDGQLLLHTRLQPDLSVVYKNKKQLKVFTLAAYYKPLIRIAAVLLCVGMIGFYAYRADQNNGQTATNAPGASQPGLAKQLPPDNKEPLAVSKNTPNQEPAEKVNSIEVAVVKPLPVKATVAPEKRVVRHAQLAAIGIAPQKNNSGQLNTADLSHLALPEQLAFRQQNLPAAAAQGPEYLDFKTWVARRIKKEASLENENTLLSKINKVTNADIVLEKDTSGKITRFEIAGLGWALK